MAGHGTRAGAFGISLYANAQQQWATAETDRNGNYTLSGLLPGEFAVTLDLEHAPYELVGGLPMRQVTITSPEQRVTGIDFIVEAAGVVWGYVMTRDKEPVRGSEVLLCSSESIVSQAMNAVMKHLQPFLESGTVKQKGTFVIGTVAGDLHTIGKNLVSMTIKGGGYKIIDLGVDVSTEKFLDAIKEHPGCFVGLSALLTTTMDNMEKSVQAIKEAYPETKVLIGGAPVSESFRAKIGADFYSPVAQQAVNFLNTNLP